MSSSEALPLVGSTVSTAPKRLTTPFRWNLRRRRRRLPTVRLGGEKKQRSGGFSLIRVCRKAKLQWLRLRYLSLIRKLKKQYDLFVEDLVVATNTTEDYRKSLILEASVVIPVMGL
ncbi:uncharacterized protein LOC127263080 [Andrographis paniculata]|uniref:uncharacterized protein LOC127263080 n=1 Tax=Andrographis paniculata TaxID=175694 RepID=UPI0021E85D84|nr:uncharacterized protein LOC127263080 [Andrographis paniculata]